MEHYSTTAFISGHNLSALRNEKFRDQQTEIVAHLEPFTYHITCTLSFIEFKTGLWAA